MIKKIIEFLLFIILLLIIFLTYKNNFETQQVIKSDIEPINNINMQIKNNMPEGIISGNIYNQLISKINYIINTNDDKELIILCKLILEDINNIYVAKSILQDITSTDDILDLKYLINEYINKNPIY